MTATQSRLCGLCGGAGGRWTPLPKAEAPTEATAETLFSEDNFAEESLNAHTAERGGLRVIIQLYCDE